MDEAILTQLRRIRERYRELTDEMGRPEVASDFEQMNRLAKERADLAGIVELLDAYEAAASAAEDARQMLAEDDEEMRALAQSELAAAEARIETLTAQIRRALLPKDPRDERNVIVEIRGGAGGEEAALFGSELFRMYTRYAERHRWQSEVLDVSESEKGGFKEVVFEIRVTARIRD